MLGLLPFFPLLVPKEFPRAREDWLCLLVLLPGGVLRGGSSAPGLGASQAPQICCFIEFERVQREHVHSRARRLLSNGEGSLADPDGDLKVFVGGTMSEGNGGNLGLDWICISVVSRAAGAEERRNLFFRAGIGGGKGTGGGTGTTGDVTTIAGVGRGSSGALSSSCSRTRATKGDNGEIDKFSIEGDKKEREDAFFSVDVGWDNTIVEAPEQTRAGEDEELVTIATGGERRQEEHARGEDEKADDEGDAADSEADAADTGVVGFAREIGAKNPVISASFLVGLRLCAFLPRTVFTEVTLSSEI